jgi:subfamily B ATP-binding cassette protein MsbA
VRDNNSIYINNKKKYNTLVQMKRLFTVNFPIWIISILGALITSIPWFLSILVTATVQKVSIDFIVQKQNIFQYTIHIVVIVVLLRIPTILGYAVNSWASEKLSSTLQKKIVKHWIFRDMSVETKYNSGDIMTRLIDDCSDNISEFYFQGFGLRIVEPIITGVLALVTLFIIDYRFLISSIIFGTISTIISLIFTKRVEELQTMHQNNNSFATESFTENIRNILTVKTLNIKSERMDIFNNLNKESSLLGFKVELIDVLTKNISLIMELINVIICFYLGSFITGFNFSNIIIVLQMQMFVNNMLSNFGTMWNYLVKTSISSKRIFDIIDEVEQVMDFLKGDIEDIKERKYMLEIKSLSFFYDDRLILDKISLSAETGEIIIILGETGSGKSTLLDIISGFKNGYDGSIKINGKEISSLSNNQRFELIRLFEQDNSLFNVSIKENIQIASNSSLEEFKLIEYSKKVGMSMIDKLPLKYDTKVGESAANFSGGEKQRISLMRLFATKSPILLLDEPTSSLDKLSEELICQSLIELKSNKILIINSHRTKLLEIADRIYILKDGKFIESGSHDYLISLKGYYYNKFYKKIDNYS